MTNWLDTFHQHFTVQPADSPQSIREVMALRYQVYCVEHAFEDRRQYPDGLEYDNFDDVSVHSLLRHNLTQGVVAAVRLVLPRAYIGGGALPIELHCEIDPACRQEVLDFPRTQVAEISRFAVSKVFRRRVGEAQTTHGIAQSIEISQENDEERRLIPQITLGLFQAIVTMSSQNDIAFWFAVMEPQLLRLLKRFGIVFRQAGPVVEYHGKRIPCIGKVSDVMTGIRLTCPQVWEFITLGGKNTLGS